MPTADGVMDLVRILKKLAGEYSDKLSFEVLSGGMILPSEPTPIGRSAEYISKAYKTVEARTGIKFGEDYLWHIFHPEESDWFPNSEKPAIALCVFKEYYPDQQVQFASDLQYALHYEGRDLTDNEAYRHLLEKYNIPDKEFYSKLGAEEYKEKAYYEFALAKQLKVSGFPTVFVQENESKFFVVARGFTEYENLKASVDGVLQSLTI